MKYKNLNLLGTSHIAKQSLNEVRKSFEELKPGIVALELDKQRLPVLISGIRPKLRLRDIFSMGIKAYLFNKFGAWAEEKLGKAVGVKPGSEMRLAYELASKNKCRVALVDQNIQVTLKRLVKSITLKEKLRFVLDILKGVITRKPEIYFDLNTVPSEDIIKKMVDKVKVRYPNVHRVLIEERNQYMAKRLAMLMSAHEDVEILAIVGAGHEKEMVEIIKRESN